ncbi:MAG: hypothetical protein GWN30_18645 [Gammaproteobacteria bacterium]|nr:hypothetical protein [Gammaproteobacteria bacterium]
MSTDIDQSPAGSITGIEENQQVQPTNSIDQIEASPEPTMEPTTSPSQTPDVRLTQESDLVSGDQQESCIVDYNRNFEAKVIELINQEREKEGLKPLTEQAQLTQAARLHSEDMACNKFFSHDSPTSGNVDTRVTDQGYQYSAIGENIAGGYDTPSSVVEGWMDSTGHRANILNGSFTQIGVGYVILEGSQLGVYWTLLIGAP